ncbi:metal-dependent hydrolase [Paenibacillus sp. GCM10027629]|uniref:metal-dependent hydrolase n=1 Tax=Paenibacillus sp. GCM10027629 TaxID=3273414 RepID=UPI00362CE7B5
MDTGTHLVMGLGIAGLSYIDPAVAADPALASAVFFGAVIAGQAPDFDGFLRLKSNTLYIRHHRGITHSLPFLLLWTVLITGIFSFLWGFAWGSAAIFHLGFWVLLSTCYHVFSDLFNTYGTQAARPFSSKWISWNIIHIFDPTIFTTHVIAIVLWAFGLAKPEVIFPILYGFIAIYYVWRTVVHWILERRLPEIDPDHAPGDTYIAIPTVSLTHWHIVKTRQDGCFILGHYDRTGLRFMETAECSNHAAVEGSRADPTVQSFLYLTNYACAEVREIRAGYIVRWSDVRYRHRKQYPFVAIVMMDREFKTIDSYVGWISDSQIQKKWSLLLS